MVLSAFLWGSGQPIGCWFFFCSGGAVLFESAPPRVFPSSFQVIFTFGLFLATSFWKMIQEEVLLLAVGRDGRFGLSVWKGSWSLFLIHLLSLKEFEVINQRWKIFYCSLEHFLFLPERLTIAFEDFLVSPSLSWFERWRVLRFQWNLFLRMYAFDLFSSHLPLLLGWVGEFLDHFFYLTPGSHSHTWIALVKVFLVVLGRLLAFLKFPNVVNWRFE